jgi:hypothetical protein
MVMMCVYRRCAPLAIGGRLRHGWDMIIALIAIFCAGTLNFAMHRAFLESDDPLIAQVARPLAERLGPHTTYIFEFLLLVGAMALATRSWSAALLSYGAYTIFNAAAFAWIMNRPQ